MRIALGIAAVLALGGCRTQVTNLGGNGGPTTIASLIQLPPTNLVSDGTTLFWVSSVGNGGPVSSVPVGGGAITAVVPGQIGGGFLAVDDVNVYYLGQMGGLYRAPKNGGGSPSAVIDPTANIYVGTTLGADVYWIEVTGSLPSLSLTIKSAPLQGGSPSVLREFDTDGSLDQDALGVTTATVFLSLFPPGLIEFPNGPGALDSGVPPGLPGFTYGCPTLVSTADAVYGVCNSVITGIASDGTATTLGSLVTGTGSIGDTSGLLAVDDTNVYWVDRAAVGTIMSAPKTGGTASIIVRDTNPIAIAVDASAIYWSDEGGNIMRLAK